MVSDDGVFSQTTISITDLMIGGWGGGLGTHCHTFIIGLIRSESMIFLGGGACGRILFTRNSQFWESTSPVDPKICNVHYIK